MDVPKALSRIHQFSEKIWLQKRDDKKADINPVTQGYYQLKDKVLGGRTQYPDAYSTTEKWQETVKGFVLNALDNLLKTHLKMSPELQDDVHEYLKNCLEDEYVSNLVQQLAQESLLQKSMQHVLLNREVVNPVLDVLQDIQDQNTFEDEGESNLSFDPAFLKHGDVKTQLKKLGEFALKRALMQGTKDLGKCVLSSNNTKIYHNYGAKKLKLPGIFAAISDRVDTVAKANFSQPIQVIFNDAAVGAFLEKTVRENLVTMLIQDKIVASPDDGFHVQYGRVVPYSRMDGFLSLYGDCNLFGSEKEIMGKVWERVNTQLCGYYPKSTNSKIRNAQQNLYENRQNALNGFAKSILEQAQALPKPNYQLLPKQFAFHVKDFAELLAANRLVHRSLRRVMKAHLSQEFLCPKVSTKMLQNRLDAEELRFERDWKVARTFRLPGGDGVTVTFNIGNRGGLSDLVVTEGSYEKIAGRLQELQVQLAMSNPAMASLFRSALSGNLDLSAFQGIGALDFMDLKSIMGNLSVLMFGLEGFRNPGTFLINPLLFIHWERNQDYDFKTLVEEMPMAPKGSVPAGRGVHKKFGGNYVHIGKAGNTNTLEAAEKSVLNRAMDGLGARASKKEFKEKLLTPALEFLGLPTNLVALLKK